MVIRFNFNHLLPLFDLVAPPSCILSSTPCSWWRSSDTNWQRTDWKRGTPLKELVPLLPCSCLPFRQYWCQSSSIIVEVHISTSADSCWHHEQINKKCWHNIFISDRWRLKNLNLGLGSCPNDLSCCRRCFISHGKVKFSHFLGSPCHGHHHWCTLFAKMPPFIGEPWSCAVFSSYHIMPSLTFGQQECQHCQNWC